MTYLKRHNQPKVLQLKVTDVISQFQCSVKIFAEESFIGLAPYYLNLLNNSFIIKVPYDEVSSKML